MSEKINTESNTERENLLQNLAYLRQKHNLSQAQMAKILGIGITTWRKIEQGIMPPRLSTAVVYNAADAFGIPTSHLFSDIQEQKTESAIQILLRELSRGEESMQDDTPVTLEDAVKLFTKTP